MVDPVMLPLLRDLVAFVAPAPLPLAQVMDAWRTSCPRLTVWEDAIDQGLVEVVRSEDGALLVRPGKAGLAMLETLRSRARA